MLTIFMKTVFFLGNAAVDLKDQLINFNKAIIEFY